MAAVPLPALSVIRDAAAAAVVIDESRLRLVRELAEPASGSELARRLGQPRQRINYHLRELEKAGLVRLVEERRKGNCTERVVQAVARAYVVSPEVMGAISPDPAHVADRASSAYLIAVASQAIGEVGLLRERAQRAGKKLATLSLQTEVRFESAQAMNAFAEELASAVAGIVAKHHREQAAAPEGRLFKVFVGSYPAITRPEEPPPATDPTREPGVQS